MAHFVFYDTPEEVAQKAARLRYLISGDRVVRAMARMARLAVKYSPDQPRVPAGNRDGGQWTDEGGLGAEYVRIAMNDEESDRTDEMDPIMSGLRQAAFNNSIRQLRRLDPNNPNLSYVTDGSAPGADVVNHIEQEVEKARTAAAIKIANGHAFADHAAEFGITSRSDFADLIRQIISDPYVEVRDLLRGRTVYYKASTNTAVFVQPLTPDGGSMFKPVDGQKYIDSQNEAGR